MLPAGRLHLGNFAVWRRGKRRVISHHPGRYPRSGSCCNCNMAMETHPASVAGTDALPRSLGFPTQVLARRNQTRERTARGEGARDGTSRREVRIGFRLVFQRARVGTPSHAFPPLSGGVDEVTQYLYPADPHSIFAFSPDASFCSGIAEELRDRGGGAWGKTWSVSGCRLFKAAYCAGGARFGLVPAATARPDPPPCVRRAAASRAPRILGEVS